MNVNALDISEGTTWQVFSAGPGPIHRTDYDKHLSRTVDFGPHFTQIFDGIIERNAGEIDFDSGNTTLASAFAADLQRQIRFGLPRESGSDDSYRGYLMIEPESMVGVMNRLMALGKVRKASGQRLDFKYTVPESNPRIFLEYGYATGFMQSLIVIYGDTRLEIEEIFTSLVQMNWDPIENKRRQVAERLINQYTLKGAERFQDYHTLEYNTYSGHTYQQKRT